MTDALKRARPGCYEFAMDFLGGEEATQLGSYIEQLEGELAQKNEIIEAQWEDRQGPLKQAELYMSECNRLEKERDTLRAEVESLRAGRAVPDGWKLVPVKITPVMKDVGIQFEFASVSDGRLLAQSMWNELLAAAPTPPQAEQAGKGEAYAYAVYFPDQPTEVLVHDLEDLVDDMTNREHVVTLLFDHPAPQPDDARDAKRYRLIRRGQHWSVVNGIGDTLRGDELDAALSAHEQKAGE